MRQQPRHQGAALGPKMTLETMRDNRKRTALIMGGGAWGSAIATALSYQKHLDVHLLVRDKATCDALAQQKVPRLPDITLPQALHATTDDEILAQADIIYLVLPASASQEALERIAAFAPPTCPVVLCAKGLVCYQEAPHRIEHLFLPELMARQAPSRAYAILSGPSFADEVIQNLPAALVAASSNEALIQSISDDFVASRLRIYGSDDPIGVAIGGALKNIIALAAGICEGLSLGDNARAALITRGLAETARFITALDGKPQTISGLAGIGDLTLTAAGPHSRNMAYGIALGRGADTPKNLCEGARSGPLLAARAARLAIDMPITQAVAKALDGAPLDDLIADLLARPRVKE